MRLTILCLLTIHALVGLSTSEALARPRVQQATITCDQSGCSDRRSPQPVQRAAQAAGEAVDRAARLIPHPAGCPRRAFCGCGAAIRIFGQARRDLWLAAAWLRFPRAAPAPGMAAARRGHVFVLEQHVGGDQWLVTDYNSGGRKSRVHVRSIRGFAIVNPRGGVA